MPSYCWVLRVMKHAITMRMTYRAMEANVMEYSTTAISYPMYLLPRTTRTCALSRQSTVIPSRHLVARSTRIISQINSSRPSLLNIRLSLQLLASGFKVSTPVTKSLHQFTSSCQSDHWPQPTPKTLKRNPFTSTIL